MEEEVTSAVATVGNEHTAIITRRGMLYTTGLNVCGELGLGPSCGTEVRGWMRRECSVHACTCRRDLQGSCLATSTTL